MTTCVYCARELPVEEFSLEHIFPAALGGKSCGDLFKTRSACRRCNSLLGLFVDAAFVKSWFTTNGASASAFQYLDPQDGGIVPYTYLGILDELSDDARTCEFWAGPSGENVFVRGLRDERYFGYAGGNPLNTRKLGRDAIIYGTTKSPYWVKLGLLSFADFFSSDRRYSGNFQIQPGSDPSGIFTQPSSEGADFIKAVQSFRETLADNSYKCRFSIDIGFADRFLAKLALGIGSTVLGGGYVLSTYATHLRNSLWAKTAEEREAHPVRGVGYWNEDSRMDSIMSFPGAHTLALHQFGNDLALQVYIYGRRSGAIVITDEYGTFPLQSPLAFGDGIVFVLVPSRRICTQPIPMSQFIAHKTGNYKHPELTHIESLAVKLKDLPPR